MNILFISLSICPLKKKALTILQTDLPTIFHFLIKASLETLWLRHLEIIDMSESCKNFFFYYHFNKLLFSYSVIQGLRSQTTPQDLSCGFLI